MASQKPKGVGSASGGPAADISKEDMMHLTMKMSKRIKTMEVQQQKLKVAFAKSQAFAEQVSQWIKTEVVQMPPPSALMSSSATSSSTRAASDAGATNHHPLAASASGIEFASPSQKKADGSSSGRVTSVNSEDRLTELGTWKAAWAQQEEQRNLNLATMQQSHLEAIHERDKRIRELEQQQRKALLTSNSDVSLKNTRNEIDGSSPRDSNATELLRAEMERLEAAVDARRQESEAATAQLGASTREVERLQQRCGQLEGALAEATVEASQRKEQSNSMATKAAKRAEEYEEQVVHLKMQLQALRESSGKEREEFAKNRAALAKTTEANERLKKTLTDLRGKHREALAKTQEANEANNASAALLAEKGALVRKLESDASALRRRLKSDVDAADRTAELTEKVGRLETELRAAEKRGADAAGAHAEAVAKGALVTRLRSEAAAAEMVHATRTAFIATRDAEIAALKVELEAAQRSGKEGAEELAAQQITRQNLERELAECLGKHKTDILRLTSERDEAISRASKELEEVRATFDREMQAQREEYSRRAALARELVKEKDAALQKVTAEADELRSEVESGGHSERKIFQLAQAQASRDADMKISVGTRDEQLASLRAMVKDREAFIARRAEQFSKLSAEVSQLRRMSRREGVNMEYLKNVVVQYLSLRDGSQRATLERVLGTLLQFSPTERRQIEIANDPLTAVDAWMGSWADWTGFGSSASSGSNSIAIGDGSGPLSGYTSGVVKTIRPKPRTAAMPPPRTPDGVTSKSAAAHGTGVGVGGAYRSDARESQQKKPPQSL